MKILSTIREIKSIIIIFIVVTVQFMLHAEPDPLTIQLGFYTRDPKGIAFAERDQSLKLWVETIFKNSHDKYFASSIVKNTFYHSKSVMMDDIEKGKLDFVNISTYDFLELNLKNKFIPLLAGSKSKDSKFERFLLVAQKKSTVNNIAEINKGQIIIPNTYASNLTKIWLQSELKTKLKPNNYSSIKIVESVKKENEILFSIFFQKTEYAVISEGTYLIAAEINPQIRNNTKIIAISGKYINNFFVCRCNIDPKIYQEVVNIGLDLDNIIEGKQILNLVQMTEMHKIYYSDLNETEMLIKQYRKLFPLEKPKN